MAVTRKRSHRQIVSICHFVSYIMYFYKIKVYRNFVGGGGGGGVESMAGPRSICSRAMVASLHYVQIRDKRRNVRNVPSVMCVQRRFRSSSAFAYQPVDEQVDLSLPGTHMSEGPFTHIAAPTCMHIMNNIFGVLVSNKCHHENIPI